MSWCLAAAAKKLPASPAASLQKLDNCPQKQQPAGQRRQPEHRQQQAVVGTVADTVPVVPAQGVPVAHPQRGLHPPPSDQIVPYAPHLRSSSAALLPPSPWSSTPCHPQGRSLDRCDIIKSAAAGWPNLPRSSRFPCCRQARRREFDRRGRCVLLIANRWQAKQAYDVRPHAFRGCSW